MARRDPKYRQAHDKLRAQYARALKRGPLPCARGCGHPILPGEPFDLDHVEGTVDQYRGVSHVRCNRATSTHRANRAQSADVGIWSRCWWCKPGDHDPRCPVSRGVRACEDAAA